MNGKIDKTADDKIKVVKIVTHPDEYGNPHDGVYYCRTQEELDTFIKNYRERGKFLAHRIKSQWLVDHMENMEMTEKEFNEMPVSNWSAKYFGLLDEPETEQEAQDESP